MSNDLFWERDSKGNLIPKEVEFVVGNKIISEKLSEVKNALLMDEQNKYADKEQDEIRLKNIEERKKAIEELEKIQKEYEVKYNISFIPLLPYQIRNLQNNSKSCNGETIEDQEADICANCCIVPKRTYEQWRDMKDPTEKIHIAQHIFVYSFPKKSEKEKQKQQELFRLLRALR